MSEKQISQTTITNDVENLTQNLSQEEQILEQYNNYLDDLVEKINHIWANNNEKKTYHTVIVFDDSATFDPSKKMRLMNAIKGTHRTGMTAYSFFWKTFFNFSLKNKVKPFLEDLCSRLPNHIKPMLYQIKSKIIGAGQYQYTYNLIVSWQPDHTDAIQMIAENDFTAPVKTFCDDQTDLSIKQIRKTLVGKKQEVVTN
jgi:hypothetical protein